MGSPASWSRLVVGEFIALGLIVESLCADELAGGLASSSAMIYDLMMDGIIERYGGGVLGSYGDLALASSLFGIGYGDLAMFFGIDKAKDAPRGSPYRNHG